MQKLTHDDLLTLEAYSQERTAFRTRVLAHKQQRTVHLGAHITLIFEDRLTIQYQVQEMLRIERIFESAGITEELDAYNPLIPDGTNLKATMLIEFADPDERAKRLIEMHGIENKIAMSVGDLQPVIAIADEDLDRSTDQKTSAVHFMRFELSAPHIAAFKQGDRIVVSVDHPAYRGEIVLSADSVRALAADFA
ncbi:MAG TPA: DUF3501 family protein [Rudaea sp.]|jgi:hypothetical protein|nr:DUF3501 family protein [Rudaea sp.]